MGAYTAKSIGLLALSWSTDPIATAAGWWWPATSVAAAVVAAMLVAALPTRLLAPVVTALAGFGLLVFFYVALAVLARVASGTAPIAMPMQVGATAAPSEWGPAVLVVITRRRRARIRDSDNPPTTGWRSVARPLGWALAFTVVVPRRRGRPSTWHLRGLSLRRSRSHRDRLGDVRRVGQPAGCSPPGCDGHRGYARAALGADALYRTTEWPPAGSC
jgi:hypothetical protein